MLNFLSPTFSITSIMKLFLTVSFIIFSLFSSIIEYRAIELPLDTTSISSNTIKEHVESNCDQSEKNHCHDSNCFGSAHFGHGFYYLEDAVLVAHDLTVLYLNPTFPFLSHKSAVYLDSIFRPPLALS